MLRLCSCETATFAVPQMAITPNDLYQASLRGENVDMSNLQYNPPTNGKELNEPPLEHMRGTDIVDLWNKQQAVADAKLNVTETARHKKRSIDNIMK